jgi:hypothetical protein
MYADINLRVIEGFNIIYYVIDAAGSDRLNIQDVKELEKL